MENEQAKKIEIRALEPNVLSSSVASFTDSVSMRLELNNTCGNFTYRVQEPESEFVSVAHQGGSDTFVVLVNTTEYDKIGSHEVTIEVGLQNYPDVAKAYSKLTVDVTPALEKFIPIFENKTDEADVPEIEEEKAVLNETDSIPVKVWVPPEPKRIVEKADKLADEIRNKVIEEQESFPNPVPFIYSASETGLVKITFSKPL